MKRYLPLYIFVAIIVVAGIKLGGIARPNHTPTDASPTPTPSPPVFNVKKQAVLQNALTFLSDSDKADMEQFLQNLNITSDKLPFARFLYFCAYGWSEQIGEGKQKYWSGLHDFSMEYPSGWKVHPAQPNNIGLLVAETPSSALGYAMEDIIFDVYFFKNGEDLTHDQFIRKQLQRQARNTPIKKISGPEETQLFDWKATRYTYKLSQSRMGKKSLTNSDVMFEDYCIQVNGLSFIISYRYGVKVHDTYRNQADAIVQSFQPGYLTYQTATEGFTDDQLFPLFPGGASVYQYAVSQR